MRETNGTLSGYLIIPKLIIKLFLGGIAIQYVVEYWGGVIRQQPIDAPFWACIIAGIFVGEFTIPAAVITLLYRACFT